MSGISRLPTAVCRCVLQKPAFCVSESFNSTKAGYWYPLPSLGLRQLTKLTIIKRDFLINGLTWFRFFFRSQKCLRLGLEFFTNVLLVSSHQDKYVPPHSARIELCEKAVKDDSLFGRTYRTMVDNILSPIISKPDLKLVRYDVSFPLSTSAANNLIGRTAHIAVLDSEVWMEKFFTVVALKYFT